MPIAVTPPSQPLRANLTADQVKSFADLITVPEGQTVTVIQIQIKPDGTGLLNVASK